MGLEPNFPKSNTPQARPKGKLLVAVLLGLLTFVVTPLVAVIIAVPFIFLGKISEGLNPIIFVAAILGLRELGGFFAAQFTLTVFVSLLGDGAVAAISWFINRSKKLAAVTFVSAVIFQCVSDLIIFPVVVQRSRETMLAGIESEKSYQQLARIGNVSFDVQEPYSDVEMDNRRPEYGRLYKKLQIVIPVSVSQAGTYQMHVRYSFSKAGETGSTSMRNVTEPLGVGEHTVKIEFSAHEISSYGFWSPASVGGTAEVQLSYLASGEELLGKIDSSGPVDTKILEHFLKEEGLDTRAVRTRPAIHKFIERKEVHF